MDEDKAFTDEQVAAYKMLKLHRKRLSRDQIKTLCGQVKAGNPSAAMKGLHKILSQNEARCQKWQDRAKK